MSNAKLPAPTKTKKLLVDLKARSKELLELTNGAASYDVGIQAKHRWLEVNLCIAKIKKHLK